MIKEYIVPIEDKALEYDEMFVGVIRRNHELVRCRCCFHYRHKYFEDYCVITGNRVSADDYCSWAERKEE